MLIWLFLESEKILQIYWNWNLFPFMIPSFLQEFFRASLRCVPHKRFFGVIASSRRRVVRVFIPCKTAVRVIRVMKIFSICLILPVGVPTRTDIKKFVLLIWSNFSFIRMATQYTVVLNFLYIATVQIFHMGSISLCGCARGDHSRHKNYQKTWPHNDLLWLRRWWKRNDIHISIAPLDPLISC